MSSESLGRWIRSKWFCLISTPRKIPLAKGSTVIQAVSSVVLVPFSHQQHDHDPSNKWIWRYSQGYLFQVFVFMEWVSTQIQFLMVLFVTWLFVIWVCFTFWNWVFILLHVGGWSSVCLDWHRSMKRLTGGLFWVWTWTHRKNTEQQKTCCPHAPPECLWWGLSVCQWMCCQLCAAATNSAMASRCFAAFVITSIKIKQGFDVVQLQTTITHWSNTQPG